MEEKIITPSELTNDKKLAIQDDNTVVLTIDASVELSNNKGDDNNG